MLFQPRMKFICAALSLPVPPESCDEVKNEANGISSDNVDQKPVKKLLLVGCDQSGTSTIFKQVKLFLGSKKMQAIPSCFGIFVLVCSIKSFCQRREILSQFHSFIHDCVWFL